MVTGALEWLDALNASFDFPESAWAWWEALDARLAAVAASDPGPGDVRARSTWLKRVRNGLADLAVADGSSAALWRAGAQFLAGYRDLDLREATGTGHGQMILDHAPAPVAAVWRERLASGALVGIAATESHGGSRIREITTGATMAPDGTWRITGEKRWVSRLEESDAFVVFVRDPDGSISAVIIDGASPGVHRRVIAPAGLGGWTWGVVGFDDVSVDPASGLLGEVGAGLDNFNAHFTRFRPLVTACALGAAAAVHDRVRAVLIAKRDCGVVPRIRDNAFIALGTAWAQVVAALLLAFHASLTHVSGHTTGFLASRLGKAHGVDAACRVVDLLAPLVGAVGFQRDHPIAKARLDLAALQYADGIGDSLYRSGGIELLGGSRPSGAVGE